MGRTLKVAVLSGGRSAEREVSLRSGEAVFQALLSKGFDAWKVDARENLAGELLQRKPDVVFIALHGPYGEDGTVQGLLEVMDLPYTGPGVLASAMAMNKIITKRLLAQAGLPTAEWALVHREEIMSDCPEKVASRLLAQLGGRAVLKVPHSGSSIGVYPAASEVEAVKALRLCLTECDQALAEKYLPGVEVSVPVLGNARPRALPALEIVLPGDMYDYQAKYSPGGSQHLIPPRLSKPLQDEIAALALDTYALLGCSGFSRIDLRLDENSRPMILEVNTIPGLTETSLLPDSAKAAGMEFGDLIEEIIRLALEKKDRQ